MSMHKLAAAALALLATPALASEIEITVEGQANGVIKIDLLEDVAPNHVARITTLANEGAYDGVVFHRVIEGFMAQTGDVQFGNATKDGFSMQRAGAGASQYPDVKAEFSDYPFDRGVVGIARGPDPDSGNSQFFIMFAPGMFLNGQYTVVGEVTSGMEVVDQIKRGKGPNGAVIGAPDIMKTVRVTAE